MRIEQTVNDVRTWRWSGVLRLCTLCGVAVIPVALALAQDPNGRASLQQAQLISKKDPVYPKLARETGARGVVEMIATIGTDGQVKAVKVVHGPPMLQKAAADAVMQWRYKPTSLNGVPVEAQTQVFVNFQGAPPAQDEPGPDFQQAELTTRVEPLHPGGNLQGLEGTVVLKAKIGLDGRLSDIHVTDAPAELVPAALEAVKQWVYRPAMRNGEPIETNTEITLSFKAGK